ncbi:MAG: choice-of-anchor X domain-containing protein [Lysobacterales bacterium]
MSKLSVWVSSLLSVGMALPAGAAGLPPTKQLGGPASEFAQMAPADPAASAIESKSLLLPVLLSRGSDGRYGWQGQLPIESSAARLVLLNNQAIDWTLSLQAPGARASNAAERLAQQVSSTQYGMGDAQYAGQYYAFDGLEQGAWGVQIDAGSAAQQRGFILLEGGGPARLRSQQVAFNQTVGQTLNFRASAFNVDATGFSEVGAPTIRAASMLVTAPSGQQQLVNMLDDGGHQDGRARDGVYGGGFQALESGSYTVQVRMEGVGVDGVAFARSAEHLVPVVATDLQLLASSAAAKVVNDRQISIELPVSSRQPLSHYRVYAELWANNGRQPVSWVAGMSELSGGKLTLGLDAHWLALANANAGLELRNLRIEDPDHFITIAKASSLKLSLDRLPRAATEAVIGIDEQMRVGPRPAGLQTEGTGTRLLLVHGYCSGNVWGSQIGRFTNESVFQDLNKNRSHDDFARRIRDFGATWNSFGVVAHSQGGAAATHLYTYYWSGLDNATGNRLIQSVGTPYQGTALAGNLAVLGQVFGVGCGTNSNLTYSGASSWLSGIPSWARAKVHYYTTSFNDRWWAYDYCHIATDLLLNDPDDGTTERAYGQLSGAVNRGHKTGWCHTSGMRDPAQTTDASRNNDMNNNAAR